MVSPHLTTFHHISPHLTTTLKQFEAYHHRIPIFSHLHPQVLTVPVPWPWTVAPPVPWRRPRGWRGAWRSSWRTAARESAWAFAWRTGWKKCWTYGGQWWKYGGNMGRRWFFWWTIRGKLWFMVHLRLIWAFHKWGYPKMDGLSSMGIPGS